jgi:hypothetical protein
MTKKTRDMKVRPVPTRAGVKADFLLELSACRACLRRLAEVARTLPEGDQYYDAKDSVNTMLNRLLALEDRALQWGAV